MHWPSVQLVGGRLDYWRWKYLGNPLGFQLVCVAEQAGKVISHSASIPVLMSVGERIIVASQGVDLCTHPAFRGQGLIGATMAVRNRIKAEHGVALDYGFPNQAAYHVSSIKQGFRDLEVRMLQYQFIIDEDLFFRKVRFGALKKVGYDSFLLLKRTTSGRTERVGDHVVTGISEFTTEHGSLFQKAAFQFDLAIVRNTPYLNWRYADPRGGPFLIRSAERGGTLAGYMVHKVEDREGTRYLNIVDALVDPVDTGAARDLLVDAIALARELRIETVLCCLPEGHPYGRTLSDLGFISQVRYTGDRPMAMVWLDRGKEEGIGSLMERSGHPHIMLGDTDWV